jgi:hypothetical protein
MWVHIVPMNVKEDPAYTHSLTAFEPGRLLDNFKICCALMIFVLAIDD